MNPSLINRRVRFVECEEKLWFVEIPPEVEGKFKEMNGVLDLSFVSEPDGSWLVTLSPPELAKPAGDLEDLKR